jgi:hypothetical protein
MGDPVTMAVVGGTIGAATNRKDPLKGALMGAVGGYAGGSMMGAGAGTGGGFAGGGFGSIGTAGQTASTSPFSIGSFLNGIGTNFAAGGDPVKGAMMNASALAGSGGGGFTGGGYGSIGATSQPAASSNAILGSETLGGAWKDISAASNWMKENPTTSRIGFELAKDMMSPDQQMQMAPAGQVSRSAIQPMDYASLLNPQQQTVIRPATPSLI